MADRTLEQLVREWRDAQEEIDRTPIEERRTNRKPLDRLVNAHNALLKYAKEKL